MVFLRVRKLVVACRWKSGPGSCQEAISPVMCNVYLHRLDRDWDERDGILARYADDLIVMCWSRSQAGASLERLTALLADLGLEPKAAKTRIVHLEEGGEGFDFLGFRHRLVRSRGLNGKPRVLFLARWPADNAMQHARDRIRELTGHRRLLLPPEAIAQDVNLFLRGWTRAEARCRRPAGPGAADYVLADGLPAGFPGPRLPGAGDLLLQLLQEPD